MRHVLLLLSVTLSLFSGVAGAPNIRQTTSALELPEHFSPTPRYTTRLNGLCGQKCRNGPSAMHSASYGDTLVVAYTAIIGKGKTTPLTNALRVQSAAAGAAWGGAGMSTGEGEPDRKW